MPGSQYISPRKQNTGKGPPQYISELANRNGRVKKISAREASIPRPKPRHTIAQISAKVKALKENHSTDNGGRSTPFNEWEYGFQEYDTGNDADDEIDEDDGGYDGGSIENTHPDNHPQVIQEIQEEIQDDPNLPSDPPPASTIPRKRNYSKLLASQDDNWDVFAKAVVKLSWRSKGEPVCTCEKFITVRAISFQGTFFIQAD
jgi:hypothetical protein